MIRAIGTATRLAGLALALTMAGSVVHAADLYQKGAKVPYDDPRYAYLYGREDAAAPPGWEGRRDPARLWRHRRAEGHPEAWRDRYRYTDRRTETRPDRDCPPKSVVRRRLKSQGWFGFKHPSVIDDRYVTAEARHEEGGSYRITIERCTGRLVDARAIARARRYVDRDDEFFERFDRDDWGRRPYARQYDRFARPRGRF